MASPETFPTCSPDEVTPADIADFVYRSFYFGQGSFTLQESILTHGNGYYKPVLDTMLDTDFCTVAGTIEKRVNKWIHGSSHTSKTLKTTPVELTNEVTEAMKTLRFGKQTADLSTGTRLDNMTAHNVVRRDHRFIVNSVHGRPGRSPNGTGEYTDPFISHAMHYGILANTTRQPVMDAFFQRVGNAIVRISQQSHTETLGFSKTTHRLFTNELHEVTTLYARHHPATVEAISARLSPSVFQA